MRQTAILENHDGKIIRAINWRGSKMTAVYRIDNRRVEFVEDVAKLEKEGIAFAILKEINRSDVEKRRVPVSHIGYLRFAGDDEAVRLDVELIPEDGEKFPLILKRSAIGHVAALVFILITGWIIQKWFIDKPEPVTVAVFEQQREIAPKKRPTVAVSEKKVKPTKTKKRVARVKKPIRRAVVTRKSSRGRGNGRAGNSLMGTGALSVLGGMGKNFNGAGGLNVKATKNNPGVGYGGSAARGGLERSLIGKGLVASGVGNGGNVKGYGGYGTQGKGGGKPGYGSMKIAGGSGAYLEPLSDESLIEGGLDRDQINAVVQRNLGQIYYCYEQGLQSKPSLSGRVDVKFVIDPRGRVSTARVTNTSLAERRVEGCIVQKLRGWKFPRPVGEVNVRVELPFLLKRLSQG